MSALFAVLGLVHAVMAAALAVRALATDDERGRVGLGLAALVAAALAWDNLVVGAGTTLGEGPLLADLNTVRFTLHVLLTPLMMVAAQRLGALAGIGWARRLERPVEVLALAGIALGAAVDGLWPRVEPELSGGVLRYVHHDPTVPIPAIITVVVVLAVGAGLWRAGATSALALGAVVMFLGSAVPPGTLPVVGNLAEIAFVGGFVATGAVVATPRAAPPSSSGDHRPDVRPA